MMAQWYRVRQRHVIDTDDKSQVLEFCQEKGWDLVGSSVPLELKVKGSGMRRYFLERTVVRESTTLGPTDEVLAELEGGNSPPEVR